MSGQNWTNTTEINFCYYFPFFIRRPWLVDGKKQRSEKILETVVQSSILRVTSRSTTGPQLVSCHASRSQPHNRRAADEANANHPPRSTALHNTRQQKQNTQRDMRAKQGNGMDNGDPLPPCLAIFRRS